MADGLVVMSGEDVLQVYRGLKDETIEGAMTSLVSMAKKGCLLVEGYAQESCFWLCGNPVDR